MRGRYFKDFVTGQGMADAFLDAERLARAILDGREAAYQLYWRERDTATLPLHCDAIRQGKVGFNDAFMREVIATAAADPELSARFAQVLDRRLDPADLVPQPRLLRIVGSALLRGRLDVLTGFLRSGRQLTAARKLLVESQRALARARVELEREAPRAGALRQRRAA